VVVQVAVSCDQGSETSGIAARCQKHAAYNMSGSRPFIPIAAA
jgi:hypothetical protein